MDLLHALKAGAIDVRGAPRYRSALSTWLGVTRFAARSVDAAYASTKA
jgi:hypothetical protein